MHIEFLEILRCPKTGQRLDLKEPVYQEGRVQSGLLVTVDGLNSYPVEKFIPRFVARTNYADNFGMQWNKFAKTQLDSFSGHNISAQRFWKATGWTKNQMTSKWVLDVGCGSGRFAEIALQTGANVVALDYSESVEACYNNLKQYPNLHVVQGDIYSLPFIKESFSYIYSLGVLQHTPDVEGAFNSLPPYLKNQGSLCTDVYWKRLRTMLHLKYLLRPFTKRLPQDKLFNTLEIVVPHLLNISQVLGSVKYIGNVLKRLIPVADYTGIYPLSKEQLEEWALLDTFDMLAPAYDSPQTPTTIKKWMEDAGLKDIEILQANLLVVRGDKYDV